MAKSRSIGGIYASLSLRDKGFSGGLKRARKGLNDFRGQALKGAALGAAALGAGLATAGIAGTKGALSMVDDMGDVAKQTGVGVAAMMTLQQAYKHGGRAAEMAGKDIGKMQKNIVTAASGGADPFTAIGLSAVELLKLDPAAQFEQIGSSIMRIANPAERTAKAMEIFGKGGMGLTTVFEGMPAAAAALGKMPELAEKFAGAMGQANDLIGNLPLKSDQFFVGFTAGIIGQLLPNLKKIDDYDFTDMGLSIGSAISTGFEGLLDGSIFTIISEKFYSKMATVMGDIQNLVIESIVGGFENTPVKMAFNALTGKEIGYNPLKVLENAGKRPNPYADLSKQLESDADELWNELKAKADTKKAAAADLSTPTPIVNPIEGLAAAAAAAAQPKLPDEPVQHERDVNDYQRRGLSLGGNMARPMPNNEEVKQTQLMTDMRNFLRRMAEEGSQAAF